MARKKKRHTKHRRRRHSVGAVDIKSIGMKVVGVAGGAFVARTLFNLAQKSFPTIKPQYVGLGTIVVGALVPKFIKSDLGASVGDGIIAIGALTAMQNFGLISGIAGPRRVQSRIVNGPPNKSGLQSRIGDSMKPGLQRRVSGDNVMRKMMMQGMGALMFEE